MKRVILFALLIAMISSFSGNSVNAKFDPQSSPSPPRGNIAFEDALFAATRAVQGQVVMAELKSKEGFPVYEFEIRASEDLAWSIEVQGNTGLVMGIKKHVALQDSVFASQANISIEEAEAMAVTFMPGTVTYQNQMLDTASQAVYTFTVDSDIGGKFKFEVNAKMGEIQVISQVLWQVGGIPIRSNTQEAFNLYERLGGVEAIRAVVGSFAQRLFDDPVLAPFFGSLNEQRQRRFIDLNVDFLCQAAGGPCTYTGRSMFDAHQGLGTTNDVFNLVVEHLIATLEEFNVPEPEQREILALIETTRNDIVEE